MPPLALISATARSAPFLKLVPTVAPPPDSSPTFAILIGAPVWASAAPPSPVARARAPAIVHDFISAVLPLSYAARAPRADRLSGCLRLRRAPFHDGIERRAHHFARRPRAGKEFKGIQSLEDRQLAPGHHRRAAGPRGFQQRGPEWGIDRVRDPEVGSEKLEGNRAVPVRQHADGRAVHEAACARERLLDGARGPGGYARCERFDELGGFGRIAIEDPDLRNACSCEREGNGAADTARPDEGHRT